MSALRSRSGGTRVLDRTLAQVTDAPEHETDRVTLKVRAERQRIASLLHDDVSQLLFAMTARARRAQELDADDPAALRHTIAVLADQLQQAQDRLREVMRACGPASATDTVPVAAQRDLDDFTARTGVETHLVVRGRPTDLPPSVERVTLRCLRQALFNVERHAGARVVVVTLDYRPDQLGLVVQDDGRGLPDGFEPRVIPSGDHHWGFTSMAEQVERLGGTVLLRRVRDGDFPGDLPGDASAAPSDTRNADGTLGETGTQLHVRLPLLTEGR